MEIRKKKYVAVTVVQTIVTVLLIIAATICGYNYYSDVDEVEPLMACIVNDDTEGIQKIIDDGASIERFENKYRTAEGKEEDNPMRLALENDTDDVLETLIANQADVNHTDVDGETLLMSAAGKCEYEKVRLLVNAGADVNARDKNGEDAMYYAVTSPYNYSVADPDDPDYSYDSKEAYKIIRFLISKGLVLDIRTFEQMLYDEYNSPVDSMMTLDMIMSDYEKGDIDLRGIDKSILDDIYLDNENEVLRYIEKNGHADIKYIAYCVAHDNIDALVTYNKNGGDIKALLGYRFYENLYMVAAAFDSMKCADYLKTEGVPLSVTIDFDYQKKISALDYAEKYRGRSFLDYYQ